MPITTTGDMAWQFGSMRQGSAIKSDLGRLSASLSSGKVADVTRHLAGETGRLTAINHSLAQLDAFGLAANETVQTLDYIQDSLAMIAQTRGQVSGQLLLISDQSSDAQVEDAASSARAALDTMVGALNMRVADRVLFGGQDVDTAPVAQADQIITQVVAAIGAELTPAGIKAVVDAWFDDPAGGYETFAYRGDTGPFVQRQISDARINVAVRADDPGIRAVLKATTLAVVTASLPGLGADAKRALVQDAANTMFASSAGLTRIQARVGDTQQILSEVQTRMAAQQTGLRIAVNDLVAADPFATATRLQAVQSQLETHFAVVGRMSQLSLLRFI